jgi:hypothetical protein
MIRVHRQQLTVMMAQREAADRHTADVAAAHASQMASRFSEIQDLKGRIKALEQQADDARAPATPCQMGYQPGKEFAGQHQGVEAAAAAFEQVQLQAQAQAQARREVRLRHGAEMKALRMRLQVRATPGCGRRGRRRERRQCLFSCPTVLTKQQANLCSKLRGCKRVPESMVLPAPSHTACCRRRRARTRHASAGKWARG